MRTEVRDSEETKGRDVARRTKHMRQIHYKYKNYSSPSYASGTVMHTEPAKREANDELDDSNTVTKQIKVLIRRNKKPPKASGAENFLKETFSNK